MDKFITSHVWAVRAYCPVRELHLPFSEAISQAGFHWFTLHWMSSAFLKWWCFKEVWLMSGLNIKLCYSCSKKILWKKRFFFRQENSFQFRQSWKAKELFFFPHSWKAPQILCHPYTSLTFTTGRKVLVLWTPCAATAKVCNFSSTGQVVQTQPVRSWLHTYPVCASELMHHQTKRAQFTSQRL